MTLAASAHGVCGVWFDGQKHAPTPASTPNSWLAAPQHPVLQACTQQLEAYFAGQRQHFEVALDLSGGTAFERMVWQSLLDIAPGHTESYAHLSERLGRRSAVRAVAAAIGRNPISIIVPCHRVLGSSGALTGYAGGLDRKRALLQLEGAVTGSATPHTLRQPLP
jgi:methylated-DNA-[protein]-cysteine S-methyltransferase